MSGLGGASGQRYAVQLTPAPCVQPTEHRDFSSEVTELRSSLGELSALGSAYVLGDALNGLQWHVFVADAGLQRGLPQPPPVYTLEICMTQLCPVKVGILLEVDYPSRYVFGHAGSCIGSACTQHSRRIIYSAVVLVWHMVVLPCACSERWGIMQATQFVRGPGFVSAAATTASSGIAALLPGAAIDDYVFEPCGYSMNGVDGTAFTTIHVTPEDGFSYASVELCGYAGAALDASAVVAQARPYVWQFFAMQAVRGGCPSSRFHVVFGSCCTSGMCQGPLSCWTGTAAMAVAGE